MIREKSQKDHIPPLPDLLNPIKSQFSALSVVVGVMDGENVRQREMSTGGECMGTPPPRFKMAPNQNNSESGSLCFIGPVS